MPKLSAIIPIYNQGKYFAECLESLKAQTLKDFEIIVVDDGSIDESRHIAKQYKVDKFIELPHNFGIPTALNVGVLVSEGEYIAIISQDDLYAPTYFEKAVKALDENPKAGVFGTSLQNFGDYNEYFKAPAVWEFDVIKQNNQIYGHSIFRRKCYDEVGGYDKNTGAYCDWDLWIKICKAGWGLEYLDEPHYFFRVHNVQASKTIRQDLIDYIHEKYGLSPVDKVA